MNTDLYTSKDPHCSTAPAMTLACVGMALLCLLWSSVVVANPTSYLMPLASPDEVSRVDDGPASATGEIATEDDVVPFLRGELVSWTLCDDIPELDGQCTFVLTERKGHGAVVTVLMTAHDCTGEESWCRNGKVVSQRTKVTMTDDTAQARMGLNIKTWNTQNNLMATSATDYVETLTMRMTGYVYADGYEFDVFDGNDELMTHLALQVPMGQGYDSTCDILSRHRRDWAKALGNAAGLAIGAWAGTQVAAAGGGMFAAVGAGGLITAGGAVIIGLASSAVLALTFDLVLNEVQGSLCASEQPPEGPGGFVPPSNPNHPLTPVPAETECDQGTVLAEVCMEVGANDGGEFTTDENGLPMVDVVSESVISCFFACIPLDSFGQD